MADIIEDDLRQLRYLQQALALIADNLEDQYEGEAVSGIAWEMRARIEALQKRLFKKPKKPPLSPKLEAVT
jgi:hypothetical protein